MSKPVSASAPGKLFLTGEYAVLEGAPAILVPVPQRAKVSLTSASSEYSEGRVSSSDGTAGAESLESALKSMPLLRSVIETLNCRGLLTHRQLTLNTGEFYRAKTKLGLGSSAALTAALVKLFRPDATPEEQTRLAQQSHLAFQGGRGSGADIALSVADQSIIHQRDHSPRTVALPADLHMLAIWTGEAASTTAYLEMMANWQQSQPAAFEAHMTKLTKTADGSVAAINSGQAQNFLATISQYDRQLEALSIDSGLNFYNPAHKALRKKVELLRCTYKPSGAGGGDFGIAYSTQQADLTTLADDLEAQGRICFTLTPS